MKPAARTGPAASIDGLPPAHTHTRHLVAYARLSGLRARLIFQRSACSSMNEIWRDTGRYTDIPQEIHVGDMMRYGAPGRPERGEA